MQPQSFRKQRPVLVGRWFFMLGCACIISWVLASPSLFAQAAPREQPKKPHVIQPHIVATTVRPAELPATASGTYGLTRDTFKAIAETIPDVRWLLPIRIVPCEARFQGNTQKAELIGTTDDFAKLHQRVIQRGRFLTEQDLVRKNNVAVISDALASKLFAFQDPIGRHLLIKDNAWTIVGVFDSTKSNEKASAHIYIPYSTMRTRLGDRDLQRKTGTFRLEHFELSRIELLLDDTTHVPKIAETLRRLIASRHPDSSVKVTISNDSAPPKAPK
jgi:putative ABC transport system permease protein